MKRFLSFLTRRELLLVSLTAAVCFAIAIPISGAATRAEKPVTVAPGGDVTFPNLDWTCYSAAKSTGTTPSGKKITDPAHVACYRASNGGDIVGKWTWVGRNQILVLRCTDGVPKCPTLGKWRRTP